MNMVGRGGPIRSNHRGRNSNGSHIIHPYMDRTDKPPLPLPLPLPLPMGATPTTSSHACAACKHQRRRCQPDCILAPFFPADQPDIFVNAHRLFGVSNITKLLKSIDVSAHRDAMNSIIFHSDCRARNPVGGCLEVIRNLQDKLDMFNAQIALMNERVAFCRLSCSERNDYQNVVPNSYFAPRQQTFPIPTSSTHHQNHQNHQNQHQHQPLENQPNFLPMSSDVLQQDTEIMRGDPTSNLNVQNSTLRNINTQNEFLYNS